MSTRVEISNAAEFLQALESGDIGLRLAVLRGIEKDPAKALSYGSHEGRDVVDPLVEMGRQGESSSALLAIQTLTCFAGLRVLEFFLERLTNGMGQVLQASASYLLGQDFPREANFVALLRDDTSLRPRGAARVLGPPQPQDPPEVALRLALLHPRCTLPGTSLRWADLSGGPSCRGWWSASRARADRPLRVVPGPVGVVERGQPELAFALGRAQPVPETRAQRLR